MGELILGIDDAGRGPVIGPMVLAGCLVDEDVQPELKSLGVRDSKQLTHRRREFLEEKIKELAETFEIVVISPSKIDSEKKRGTKLNEVEAIACAKIINKINKRNKKIKVVLDCPSNSLVRWGNFLKTKIEDLSNLEISCEHKADRNHVSVSAASILAKCAREKEMDKLRKKYGKDIGSGYPSDPVTKKFLKKTIKKHNNQGIFRKSWATWKNASKNSKQMKLDL